MAGRDYKNKDTYYQGWEQEWRNAEEWLAQDRWFKDKKSIFVIKFNQEQSKVSLHDVLKYMEYKQVSEIMANPDKEEEEPKDLFYFRKQLDGGAFQYHLFPKLDLKLIEDKELMQTCDRKKFINEILELRSESKLSSLNYKEVIFTDKDDQDDSKDSREMKLIYMTWIDLWCSTFRFQDQSETVFRVN